MHGFLLMANSIPFNFRRPEVLNKNTVKTITLIFLAGFLEKFKKKILTNFCRIQFFRDYAIFSVMIQPWLITVSFLSWRPIPFLHSINMPGKVSVDFI
jgi:hypothetical protein